MPKATLIGYIAGFEIFTKAKHGLALVFSSAHSSLLAAGSGVLPGEVVLTAVRGQHLGVEGRRRSEQD